MPARAGAQARLVDRVRREYLLPKGYLSFSQIRKYLTCPACYEAEYLDGIKPSVGSALIIGLGVHAAVEDQRRACLAGETWDPDRARTMAYTTCRDKVREARDSGTGVRLDRFGHEGRLLDAAAAIALQGCRAAWGYDRARPVTAVEQQLSCDRPGSLFPFAFVARADAVHVDGGYSDLKTLGWWKEERDAWALRQMAIYAMPRYMSSRVIARCDVLLAEKRSPHRLAWYGATPTIEDLRRIYRQALQVAIDITAGRFPSRPNRWCHISHPASASHVVSMMP